MGRISGLVAGVVLLTGCYSTVLEIRTAPSSRLIAFSRTLVVADMAEPYRSAVEDAIARQLPGAATAHARADGEEAVRRALLDGIEEPGLAAEWDAVVLATVGGLTSEPLEGGGGLGAGGIPAGTGLPVGGISENPNTGSDSYAPIIVGASVTLGLVLDVSVQTLGDHREVYAVRVLQEGAKASVDDIRGLAPYAAARAGRELKKASLFE